MSALPRSRPTGRRARRLAGSVAAGAVVLTTALASTSLASAQSSVTAGAGAQPSTPESSTGSAEARGYYDARYGKSSTAKAIAARGASKAASRGATKAFAKSLPAKAVFDIDGTTGTVRMLTRLDGYLTGKSNKKPTTIALKFVKANHDALGLTSGDLNTFKLKRDYVDIGGVHHLYWVQRIGGQTVFGNGLTASVTKDGKLLTLGGSPVSKATLGAPAALEIDSPAAAIADARGRLGAASDSRAGSTDSAERVLFVTPRGSRIAWMTTVMSVSAPATQVVDAASGRLLYRNPLSSDAVGERSAQVFRNYPGAKRGGSYIGVSLTGNGWLPRGATKLQGNNAHAYSDVDDNNKASVSEEVRRFDKRLVPFKIKGMSFCKDFPCSWDPDKPFSWKTNREQNATQVFYFVNKFHDHLLAKPIGFTEAAGNFENANATKTGKAHDAVQTQTMDGASTDNGLPDGNHVDNANMSTPPDGTPPTMQMYLQHLPGTSYPDGDPFPANNTGDEAVTVYHEYTHGLSNRLVVDVMGNSTLGPIQGDAMGEAWGDWYAADSLVSDGLEVDKKGKADLALFTVRRSRRAAHPHPGHRLHAVVARVPVPPGPRLDDGPHRRLHLRRLRQGHRAPRGARRRRDLGPDPLVAARQGRLPRRSGPGDPGHGAGAVQPVVPRHAQRAPRGGHRPQPGQVPRQDLEHVRQPRHGLLRRVPRRRRRRHRRPTPRPRRTRSKTGVLTGTVKDIATGQPVGGVPVTLAFQGQGVANPTAITAADGTYAIGPVPTGHYGKLTVNGAGYVPISRDVTVAASGSALGLLGGPRLGRRERRRDGRGLRRTGLQRLRLWARRGPRPLAGDRLGQHHREQQGHADQRVRAQAPHGGHEAQGQHHVLRGRPQRHLR